MRLRPILMTSLAFILRGSAAGYQQRREVGTERGGTGVMGGMITATVLAIFFVPVFFVVVRRRFSKRTKTWNTAIR